MRILFALLFTLGGISAVSAQQTTPSTCNTNIDGFSVDKSEGAFRLNYRGVAVYEVSGNTLKHPVYGGRTVDTSCDLVKSSGEMITWVVGHQRDLLIAFGMVRENGRVVGVNRLIWFPHDGSFQSFEVRPNHEVLIKHGRKGDLHSRICWNSSNDARWRFSFRRGGSSIPDACNPDPGSVSYGAKDRYIAIGDGYVESDLGG